MKILKNLLVKLSVFSCLIIPLLVGCEKIPFKSSVGEKRDRTLIFYVASNNNLHDYLWNNVREISEAIGNNDDYHIVLFIDTEMGQSGIAKKLTPQILELKNGVYQTTEVMNGINSLDPKDMKTVLQEIITKFPADDYGLIFSSHGSGWIPGTKAFGANEADEGTVLEVRDIASNLPLKFKFIVFDACLMADVEAVYQMRNCTDYLIASVATVPGHGFDYEKNLHLLLKKEPDLKGFCSATVNGYPKEVGCTMTVVDCSQLEKLAAVNRTVFAENTINPGALSLETTRPQLVSNKYTYADYLDFVEKLLVTKNGLDDLKAQLSTTITTYYNGGNVGGELPLYLNAYSGLSHYLFGNDHEYTDEWYSEYQRYDWWKDGGCENYIPQIRNFYNPKK